MLNSGNFKSYGALIDDKKQTIRKNLKSSPPLVIMRRPEGIYVFSEKIAKVHSTIVLAGAGQAFHAVADYFRGQITEFVLRWSGKDPDGKTEINLLPPVFYQNVSAGPDILIADLVLVDIEAKKNDDYIARVDFTGDVTDMSDGDLVTVSYKALHLDDGKDDISPEGQDEVDEAKFAEESRATQRDALQKEFEAMGIGRIPHGAVDEESMAAFRAELRRVYPGDRCFLDRRNIQKKRFHWVYQEL